MSDARGSLLLAPFQQTLKLIFPKEGSGGGGGVRSVSLLLLNDDDEPCDAVLSLPDNFSAKRMGHIS